MTAATRLVLEKPLGRDLASSQAINAAVGQVFDESQIFRIDHYLGKEAVQNLMALRFANALFEPLWNRTFIDHVQITVAETVGVGGRWAYYDKSGALRDMVQNHMLQLLCLVAMEPPISLSKPTPCATRSSRCCSSLAPISGPRSASSPCAASTAPGPSAASRCPAIWRNATPTVRATPRPSSRSRPASTTGAGPACRSICAPASAWPSAARRSRSNSPVRRICSIRAKPARSSPTGWSSGVQPDEGVRLLLLNKEPGPGELRLRQTALNLSFAEAFGTHIPDAYERLLLDVIRGRQTLFMSRDELEEAWRWTDGILDGWNEYPQPVASLSGRRLGPGGGAGVDRARWPQLARRAELRRLTPGMQSPAGGAEEASDA